MVGKRYFQFKMSFYIKNNNNKNYKELWLHNRVLNFKNTFLNFQNAP